MLKKLKSSNKGFTIIEVLIVLAIAGLIMLIVFLAVPALQRNSRNTQRNSDASKVAAATLECINNHNGKTAGVCDTAALIGVDLTRQSQLVNVTVGGGTFALNAANVNLNIVCTANGNALGAVTQRSVAVTFQIETGTGTSNRCIDT
jgi:prepilin-type N-terminal cleavage/methylation domain-containing protein